jgi:tetratricopeptide (TPR) repeat protein
MTSNRIGTQIEKLIARGEWSTAQELIEKQLGKEPDDHWLWSRLSAVKYEQRDYKQAHADAMKALQIVSDCPLAQWSLAGALDMLGETKSALEVYTQLFRRGLQELKTPGADAEECWEGTEWTVGLMTDCLFRIADCLAKNGVHDEAEKFYRLFLEFLMDGAQGIYSSEDAIVRLKALQQKKADVPQALIKRAKNVEKKLMKVG